MASHCVPPTFAFIDPFGFSGIPFSLIERLLKCKTTEAFVTFMVDAINRFLEHPEDKVVQHIVEAFGGDEACREAARALPVEAHAGGQVRSLLRGATDKTERSTTCSSQRTTSWAT
ncbi:MAG: hypothetical protein M3461_23560 [Pseudomonadota bacterium]|nr:hypothetical protein [Pseudomonadota bacterium]